MGSSSRRKRTAQASRLVAEQKAPPLRVAVIRPEQPSDSTEFPGSRDIPSAAQFLRSEDATTAPPITKDPEKIEAQGQSLTSATPAGALVNFLQGNIKPAAFSLIILVATSWFVFCIWILKNDSDAGRLVDREGYKLYSYKVLAASVLFLVLIVLIIIVYIVFTVFEIVQQKLFPQDPS
jgi:hypothetical protein